MFSRAHCINCRWDKETRANTVKALLFYLGITLATLTGRGFARFQEILHQFAFGRPLPTLGLEFFVNPSESGTRWPATIAMTGLNIATQIRSVNHSPSGHRRKSPHRRTGRLSNWPNRQQ